VNELRKAAAAFLALWIVFGARAALAETLLQQLYQLEKFRNGPKTNFDALEDAGAALLKSHLAPADQGLIEYRLAHIYAQTGLVRPDRLLAHAQAALRNPLPDDERLRLRVYCGDAVQVTQKPFVERRPEAAKYYLEGLKEIDIRTLPLESPDPGPPPGRIDTDDAVERAKHAEELEKWNTLQLRSKYSKTIALHQKIMLRQIVELYTRPPLAAEELEELTLAHLGESPTRNELLAEVRSKAPAHSPDKPPANEAPAIAPPHVRLPDPAVSTPAPEASAAVPRVESSGLPTSTWLVIGAVALILLLAVAAVVFRRTGRRQGQ